MYLEAVCRVILAVTFAAAVVGKVRTRHAFVASLRQLGLARMAPAAAAVTLGAEMAAVVLLAVPSTARLGYGLALVLLLSFIAGIQVAVRTRRAVTCNCFGAGGSRLGTSHVIRNGALTAVAVTGLLSGATWSAQWPGLAGTGVSAAFGVLFAIVFIRWEDVTYLSRA